MNTRMKPYILSLVLIACMFGKLISQDIIGTYYGYSLASTRFKNTKSGKEKVTKKFYTEKVLEIHADSTFSFHYTNYHTLNTQADLEKSCKGRWCVKDDMLILNSRYTAQDFCTAKESCVATPEPGLVKFSREEVADSTTVTDQWGSRTEDLWYRCVEVSVNGSKIGRFNMDDTIYYKSKGIEKIGMSTCEWSSEVDWSYVPHDKQANCFSFILKSNIGSDNMFLEAYKINISAKGLRPLNYDDLHTSEGYEYKKTKPQNTGLLNFGGTGEEDW